MFYVSQVKSYHSRSHINIYKDPSGGGKKMSVHLKMNKNVANLNELGLNSVRVNPLLTKTGQHQNRQCWKDLEGFAHNFFFSQGRNFKNQSWLIETGSLGKEYNYFLYLVGWRR